MSALSLVSLALALLGLLLGFSGWGIGLVAGLSKTSVTDIQQRGPLTKVAIGCIVGGGFCLGLALLLAITAGLWWGFDHFLVELTPGKLAIVCIVFGPAPLLVTAIALSLAKVLGGTVDAGSAKNCTLSGINFSSIIYMLFMAYRLVFLTAGLAMLGLMGSGVWAVFRLF